MNPIYRRLTAAALTLAMGATLGACGADSGGTDNPGSDTSSGSEAKGQTLARQRLVEAKKLPAELSGVQPLKSAPPAGKTVALLTCGAIPSCQGFVPYVKEPISALSWNLKVYQGGATPQAITAAMNQIVADKPDAVIAFSIPKALISAQLKTLESLDIPFVNTFVIDEPGDGLTAIIDGKREVHERTGAYLADWAVADGGSKAHALWVTSQDYPVLGPKKDGFFNEMKELCPDCDTDVLSIASTDIGSPTVPNRIVGFLRSNPKYKYVVGAFPDLLTGVDSALQVAGLTDVKVGSSAANETALAGISSESSPWKAAVITPYEIGVVALDNIVRRMAGEPAPDEASYPLPLVMRDNLGSTKGFPPAIANAVDQYMKAWGVSDD